MLQLSSIFGCVLFLRSLGMFSCWSFTNVWMLMYFLLLDDNCHCYWRCKKGGENIKSFDWSQQPSTILWLVRGSWECLHSHGVSFNCFALFVIISFFVHLRLPHWALNLLKSTWCNLIDVLLEILNNDVKTVRISKSVGICLM